MVLRSRTECTDVGVRASLAMSKTIICDESRICAYNEEFRHFLTAFSTITCTKCLFLCAIDDICDDSTTLYKPCDTRANTTSNTALQVVRILPEGSHVLLFTHKGTWIFSRGNKPTFLQRYVPVWCLRLSHARRMYTDPRAVLQARLVDDGHSG